MIKLLATKLDLRTKWVFLLKKIFLMSFCARLIKNKIFESHFMALILCFLDTGLCFGIGTDSVWTLFFWSW